MRWPLACLILAASVLAETTFPPRPDGKADFVVDEAGMLLPRDVARINRIAGELRLHKRIPIIVVTIPSLAEYGAGDRSIRSYAMLLFDAWGIGFEEHNYGMLLLVAQADRKARIELGAGWGHGHDHEAREVMQTLIIPAFKAGEFSAGIVRGVEGLDAMGRGDSIPGPPRPLWRWVVWIAMGALVGGILHSLVTRGADGWGYDLLRWVCTTLVTLLVVLFTYRTGRAFRGGGFRGDGFSGFSGGGSFGGGFSGGGGATGSW